MQGATRGARRRRRRQLLSEVLLAPSNMGVMMAYISDVTHLMLIMQLLRDESKSIAFEAFHIFKARNPPPSLRRPQPAERGCGGGLG